MQTNMPVDPEAAAVTMAQVQDALGQIYDVIDRVGQQLEKTFQDQEDRFLEDYRKQMYSAQKNLREYTKTHSQAELTKKIEEKERGLRAHREKALKHTMESSDKLKDIKITATKLKQTLNELEDETNFIDEQMILSEEKNRRLADEAKYLKLEILKHQPDFEFWEEDFSNSNRNAEEPDQKAVPPSRFKKNASNNVVFNSADLNRLPKMPTSSNVNRRMFSQKERTYIPKYENVDEQEMQNLIKQYEREVRNNKTLNRIAEDPSFQKGKFEDIFEYCIKRALDKGNDRNYDNASVASTRLPYVSRSVDGLPLQQDGEVPEKESNYGLEGLNLAEVKLNANDKKFMIEEFLSNTDIKEYLYAKFIEENNKNKGPCLF